MIETRRDRGRNSGCGMSFAFRNLGHCGHRELSARRCNRPGSCADPRAARSHADGSIGSSEATGLPRQLLHRRHHSGGHEADRHRHGALCRGLLPPHVRGHAARWFPGFGNFRQRQSLPSSHAASSSRSSSVRVFHCSQALSSATTRVDWPGCVRTGAW